MQTTLAFTLSMPNRASWNGRWSGEDNYYAITRTFHGKKGAEKAAKILEQCSFYYRWSDGWGASVAVQRVDGVQARSIRAKSKGFCSYDWMVDSIIKHGAIYADHEAPQPQLASA